MRVGRPGAHRGRNLLPAKVHDRRVAPALLRGVFDVVEVNSSYYAIPDIRNTLRWVERTPAGFVFHVKAYSLLTGHHPRAETVPADLGVLLPRSPRRTRRGEID